jgi:hypothetical protein
MLRKVWCVLVAAVVLLGGASLPAEVNAASAGGGNGEVKVAKGKKGKKGRRGKRKGKKGKRARKNKNAAALSE